MPKFFYGMMYRTEYTRLLVAYRVTLNTGMTCMLTYRKKFCQIQRHVRTIFSVYSVRIWGTIFLCCVIPTKIPQKPFCDWWCMFNTFVSTRSVAFCTTPGKNETRRFYTKGFGLVSRLCGVVGSLSWFTKFLIGSKINIWSVVYINSKFIYSSETRVFTIIKCVIVCNVCVLWSLECVACIIVRWWGFYNPDSNLRQRLLHS